MAVFSLTILAWYEMISVLVLLLLRVVGVAKVFLYCENYLLYTATGIEISDGQIDRRLSHRFFVK